MRDKGYKKRTWIDHCCMHYWCPHARLNYIRFMKKTASREYRRYNKKLCREAM